MRDQYCEKVQLISIQLLHDKYNIAITIKYVIFVPIFAEIIYRI
jgi:hypothetical protein